MSKKVYTEEFKKQAVQLAVELKNVSRAAKQLGVRDVNIHKWKQQYKLTESGITESESVTTGKAGSMKYVNRSKRLKPARAGSSTA